MRSWVDHMIHLDFANYRSDWFQRFKFDVRHFWEGLVLDWSRDVFLGNVQYVLLDLWLDRDLWCWLDLRFWLIDWLENIFMDSIGGDGLEFLMTNDVELYGLNWSSYSLFRKYHYRFLFSLIHFSSIIFNMKLNLRQYWISCLIFVLDGWWAQNLLRSL